MSNTFSHLARQGALLALLCSTMSCIACDSKPPPPKPKPGIDAGAIVDDVADKKAEQEARFQELLKAVHEKIARNEDLNEREYELLVLNLKSCSVDGARGYVDSKCEAFNTLKSARAKPNRSVPNQPDMWKLIASKSLANESEAVRIYATQLTNTSYASGKDSYGSLLERSSVETSPVVLQALVRAMRMHVGKDPEVAERLLKLSTHPDDALRESVMIGLTSAWASGSKGTLERAMEMIEKDSSEQVRKTGCSSLGSRADDRAMPLLEAYTAWPAKDEAIYGDCLRGLLGMWSSPVPHKRPSQAAYDLSLERFSATPRDEKHPSWLAISEFSWSTKPKLVERAPWIDAKRVEALVIDLIQDKNVNWLGRNAAITSLVQLGTTAEQLKAIRDKAYKNIPTTGTSPDKYVLNKLNEQIERKLEREDKKSK